MARGALQGGQRRLNKAVHPNMAQLASQPAARQSAGVQTSPFALMEAINIATGQMSGPSGFDPLPRSAFDDSAFGPLVPLTPDPIDPTGANGRTEPRSWQYPVGWNLPGNGNREVPWQVLRASADGVGIIRRCIEVRKKHVRDLKWNFAPSEQAINDLYLKDRSKGKIDVEADLRARLQPEINRLRAYWAMPWRSSDASMGQWQNAILEDYLTLDAIAVYPQMSYGGEVLNLQLVDPATIKLLLDSYGNRPQPPHPAFQQILYGFPRGEWAASVTQDEHGNAVLENGFAASELFYYRENFRSFSPYGLSAVEQSLIDARLYLQRQKWMLAEYDDGSTPLTWIETAAAPDGTTLTLTQSRQWAQAFNAKNAGNTGERLRVKIMPNGWKAAQMATVDERYKPEYDLHLIKVLCSYFGVPLAELGFTEPTGLGNKSWHEGQADVSGRVGKRPDTAVLGDVVNSVSRQFMRMPPELEFSFANPSGTNTLEAVQRDQVRINTGQVSVNEIRQANGESLLPYPEASMQYLLAGPQGIIFLDGAKASVDAAAQQAQMATEAKVVGTAGNLDVAHRKIDDGAKARSEQQQLTREQMQQNADTQKLAEAEIVAFRTWRRRNPDPKRAFVFKYAGPDDGWADLDGLGPETVWFEGYAWMDDLTKAAAMSWLEWNTRNPTRPRGPHGRFVKANTLISALTDESKRVERAGQAVDAPSSLGGMTSPAEARAAYERIRAQRRGELAHLPRAKRLNGDNDWVDLETLRTEMGGTPGEQDAAFHDLFASSDDVVFAPESNQKALTPGIRAAAFRQGMQDKHAVTMRYPAPESHTEKDVRDAYARVQAGRTPGNEWVGLADLRAEMGGTREDQDKILHSLVVAHNDVRIIPVANLKALKARDREAALMVAGEPNHAISIRPENAPPSPLEQLQSRKRAELERARKKQARYDRNRDLGKSLASLMEALGNGGDKDTFVNQELGNAASRAHDPETAALLDEWRAAALNVEDPRAMLRGRAKEQGILIEGAPGDPVTFDRKQHELMPGSGTKAGQAAWISRPGVRDAESGTLLEKPVVHDLPPDTPDRVELQDKIARLIVRVDEEERKRESTGSLVESVDEANARFSLVLARRDLSEASPKMTKAAKGDADPKAQTPPAEAPDTRWPGWLMDTVIASMTAQALLSAMSALLGGKAISALVSGFLDWASAPGVTRSPAMVQEYLRTQTGIQGEIEAAITAPIRAAHLEGALVGQESGRALLAYQETGDILNDGPAVQVSVNWGDWVPGHPEAAQLLLEPGGLGRLLADSNIIVKGISYNRLDALGKVLGDGLAQGLSPAQIGRNVEALGLDPAWAHKVAVTETNRALSAAAIGEYKAAGMAQKGWMTAHDQRVCKICHHNAYLPDGRPRVVAIDARFPSGDLYPPGHPHCRCAPIPIVRFAPTMSEVASWSNR